MGFSKQSKATQPNSRPNQQAILSSQCKRTTFAGNSKAKWLYLRMLRYSMCNCDEIQQGKINHSSHLLSVLVIFVRYDLCCGYFDYCQGDLHQSTTNMFVCISRFFFFSLFHFTSFSSLLCTFIQLLFVNLALFFCQMIDFRN